jgi:glucose-6-phosphate isomerase
MAHIQLNLSNTNIAPHELTSLQDAVKLYHHAIHEKTGAGADYLGWIELPTHYNQNEFRRIQEAAKKIQSDSEILVVIGIGGSYLGTKAALEFHHNPFAVFEDRHFPHVIFAGHHVSTD